VDRLFSIGVVCGGCERYSPLGVVQCPWCGRGLGLANPASSLRPTQERSGTAQSVHPTAALHYTEAGSSGDAAPGPPGTAQRASEEKLMEQVKHYMCSSCMTPVPRGHKFCGRCGAPVPDEVSNLQVKFFSDMQNPDKARLLLIRGDGMDGLSYHLKAEQHLVGRQGQIEFPDDAFISPRHANLFYRDGSLVVRDEGSTNGVYFRVRGTTELAVGDTFLAGEQLFRLDPMPSASDAADFDGTFFYSSPKYPSRFRLNQILEGGAIGMTVCARGQSLQIGREEGDLNFPGDVYMSSKHATVEEREGRYFLTDHESRNGTYVRLKAEQALNHGDYLFIGRKLLRVELNLN